MQDAGTVLAVLRERGREGLPCDELYRQMFNKSLYLLAYGNIYSNQGAMTPGACDETADGMSEAKIDQIVALMRGAVPVRAGPPGADPEKERETAPARPAVLVRQAGRRGGAPAVGGVLRAGLFWPVARFPERARLSYRAAGNTADLDRDRVVYRGRHLRLLRQF